MFLLFYYFISPVSVLFSSVYNRFALLGLTPFHSLTLLADLVLHSYEAEFVKELLRKGEKKLAQFFNCTFRYIDDVLSLNNQNFSNFLHLMYPVELVVKDTTDSPNSASYLDRYLEHDINGTLTTKLYDKRGDFNFPIVSYLFLESNIPLSPAYGVYISQLIRFSRNCNSYQGFIHRSVLLTKKFLSQAFIETRLISTFKKCFGNFWSLIVSQ